MVENMPKYAHTFTLAPDNKHQYQNSPTRLKQVTYDVIQMLQTVLGNKYTWELNTEIKYITQSVESQIARIHYHGYIILTPHRS
jgi:hypothetical protein